MRTAVVRDALSAALARAVALVPSRAHLPVAGCARIEVGADGFAVGTSNFEAWYTEIVDTEPRESWCGCVDAQKLNCFVGSLPAGSEVRLQADDGRFTVSGSGATARLPWLSGDDFPVVFVVTAPGASFGIEAAELSARLRFVEPCADATGNRHHFEGVYTDPEGLLVSTDGNRLAVCRFAASMPEFSGVTLPLQIVRLLPALLRGLGEEKVRVNVTPRLMIFAAGSWKLTSKLLDSDFPAWRRVIPVRDGSPIVVETRALRTAINRVATVCHGTKPKTSAARLRLRGRELYVSAATGTADAEVETVITVEAAPRDAYCALATQFLADALGVIADERVELHFIDGSNGRAVWVCGAGQNEDGVTIMQMRI